MSAPIPHANGHAPDQTPAPDKDDPLWDQLIDDVTTREAPRRFWVCQTTVQSADLVVGWGLDLVREHRAVLLVPGNGIGLYVSDSAEGIHHLMSRAWKGCDVRLVWVDPAADTA